MTGITVNKPRVTMVAGHCCIRVHKMALPLQAKGYDIRIVLNRYPTQIQRRYKSIHVYECIEHLWETISLLDNLTDIYHVHNEPNWLVSAIKERSKKPVILDWHDSFLLRREKDETEKTRISVDERNNAHIADGFCFVSKPMQTEIYNQWPELKEKPNTILWSFVPQRFFRYDFFQWLGGICYEGRIDLPEVKTGHGGEFDFFQYCEYTDLSKELKKRGIAFYLYPARPSVIDHYKQFAYIAGGYDFYEMIRKIGRHDWGLIGNLESHKEWEGAMPNKLFEYIAAQLPILAINAGHAGKWLEKEGIGINVKTVDEIEKRWDERFECRNNLIKKRMKYTMENHIHKIEELYAKIIHL